MPSGCSMPALPSTGFDIDPARRARLEAIGGKRGRQIAALATSARCIIVAVFSTDQVADVIENHLLPALGEGSGKIVLVHEHLRSRSGGGTGRPRDAARHPLSRRAGVRHQRPGAARRRRRADRRRRRDHRGSRRYCSTRCLRGVSTSARSATAAAPSSRSI